MVRIIADILFFIALVSAPVFYLVAQFHVNRFVWHWLGVLCYSWCYVTFFGYYLLLNGGTNLIWYSHANFLIALYLILFIPLSNGKIKRTVAVLLQLLMYVYVILIRGEGPFDFVAANLMSLESDCMAIAICVLAMIDFLKKEVNDDIFRSPNFWFISGLLTYYLFGVIRSIFYNMDWFEYTVQFMFIGLVLSNVCGSICMVIGFRLWGKSLS